MARSSGKASVMVSSPAGPGHGLPVPAEELGADAVPLPLDPPIVQRSERRGRVVELVSEVKRVRLPRVHRSARGAAEGEIGFHGRLELAA